MPSSQLPPPWWGGWQPCPEKLKNKESDGWQSLTSHAIAASMFACTAQTRSVPAHVRSLEVADAEAAMTMA